VDMTFRKKISVGVIRDPWRIYGRHLN